MNMSEKGKGCDTGDDGWEDDKQLEESVSKMTERSYIQIPDLQQSPFQRGSNEDIY